MPACTDQIKANFASSNLFYTWLNAQGNLAAPIMSKTGTLTSEEKDTLTGVQTEAQAYSDCLDELNNSTAPINTANAQLRTSNANLQMQLKVGMDTLKIAQDRLLLVRHPELSTSYYDGLLSIGRPMRHYTVPILIGIATFFFCMTFFLFLNLLRFDLRFLIWIPERLFKATYEPFKHPFYIMLTICIILLSLTIYAFNK